MDKKPIEISKEQAQNIMAFLDRVPLKGLKEVGAMTSILKALLQEPEKEETEED